MRFSPLPPPIGDSLQAVVRWISNEFVKLQEAMWALEATHIHYGKEVRNIATTEVTHVVWQRGQKQRVEVLADTTLEFVNPGGCCNIMLRLIQADDEAGHAIYMPCNTHWTGGVEPEWSTDPGKVDVVSCYFDGTNFHCTASIDSRTACAAP